MHRKPKVLTKRAQPKGHRRARTSPSQWDETLREISHPNTRTDTRDDYSEEKAPGQFTPGELGQPDSDSRPDERNPQGVQGGRGPLNEEGEGNRQNAALAELEDDVDAEKDLEDRR